MDESIITPYDFIEIAIGDVTVSARPVGWDKEMVDGAGHAADGEMVAPTNFECTCPHCGDMVLFDAGLKEVKCPNCGRGEDTTLESEYPFQDPGQYGEKVVEPGPPEGAVGGLKEVQEPQEPQEPPVPDVGVAEAISQDVAEEWADTDTAEEYQELVDIIGEEDENA